MWSRSGTKTLAAVVVIGTAVAGCSEMYFDRRDTVSLGAGDAIATNKVTQTIDPWPRHSSNDRIAANGQLMQAAQDRYKRGKAYTPALPTQTSRDDQGARQGAAGTQSAMGQAASAAPAAPVRGANP
jgi:hypothetical protein